MMASQNQYQSFSAAASVAPIVLSSDNSFGNVYVAAKNSFLDFYTDEKKAIKRNACARSASCDSSFKETARSSTATPTTCRSGSPSCSDNSRTQNSALHSPDNTPRANQYQFHDASYHQFASYPNYDQAAVGFDDYYQAGGYPMDYPMMMMPMMMPEMMPYVEDLQMQMQPNVFNDQSSRKQNLRECNTEPVEEITTLMIRGIPCSLSQETLMKKIDNAGLKGKYDFFYLPRAGVKGSNLGYAFINFVDKESAVLCMGTFNGVPLEPSRSMKICVISPGDIQGLANLRNHFRRTAVSRGSRGPVFLKVFSEEESQE